MSRLSGDHVQLGDSFRLRDNDEKEKQLTEAYLQKAETAARSVLAQAKAQAAQILKNAELRAAEIIQTGQAQIEAVHQEAYEAGEQQGFQAGYAQAEVQTTELLQGAQAILESAYTAEKRVLKGFQRNALQLITYVCEKILNQSLQSDPQAILAMIDGAIESLHLTGKIRVVLGSETVETIRQHSEQTAVALEQLTRYELIADPQLGLQEIYLLSQEGNFCLTPQKQIDQLLQPIHQKLPLPELEALEILDNPPTENSLEPESDHLETELL